MQINLTDEIFFPIRLSHPIGFSITLFMDIFLYVKT